MNENELQAVVFPKWAEILLVHREVWIDIDLISQFSSYLRLHHEEAWLLTEQDPEVNENWETRFYVRSYEPSRDR